MTKNTREALEKWTAKHQPREIERDLYGWFYMDDGSRCHEAINKHGLQVLTLGPT